MLGRLPIFVVVACVLSPGLFAESISFQRNPGLVPSGQEVRTTPVFDTVSNATAGDLGRGFTNVDHVSAIRTSARELYVDGVRTGTLVTAVNRRLNFGFYRSTNPLRAVDPLTDLILRTLLDRPPKGPRGRRELAEANAR